MLLLFFRFLQDVQNIGALCTKVHAAETKILTRGGTRGSVGGASLTPVFFHAFCRGGKFIDCLSYHVIHLV